MVVNTMHTLTKFFVHNFLILGMNVNTRKLLTHVEFEPSTYGTAFAVELEAASSPLWSFVNACTSLVGILLARVK